ncbi:hypothetical protein [Paraburkholderia sp. JHI869]|uniref:hypothetical protein n=1 Tax=Paraburkholderia sp. JHI869 TaxID=3112959 RepID=UPI003179A614
MKRISLAVLSIWVSIGSTAQVEAKAHKQTTSHIGATVHHQAGTHNKRVSGHKAHAQPIKHKHKVRVHRRQGKHNHKARTYNETWVPIGRATVPDATRSEESIPDSTVPHSALRDERALSSVWVLPEECVQVLDYTGSCQPDVVQSLRVLNLPVPEIETASQMSGRLQSMLATRGLEHVTHICTGLLVEDAHKIDGLTALLTRAQVPASDACSAQIKWLSQAQSELEVRFQPEDQSQ